MTIELQISSDLNQVIIDGLKLKFYPVKKVKKTHCNWCWLLKGVPGFDCTNYIPCRDFERKDKMNGVFSIREMQKESIKI